MDFPPSNQSKGTDLSEVSLETVKQWWEESSKFSLQSNDALLSVLTKGFETIYTVLSQESDENRVNRSIASLNFERIQALDCEKKEFDSLRHLVFGLVESIQIALSQLKRFEKDGQEKIRQTTVLKEEPVEVSGPFELADLESVGTNPPSTRDDMSAGDLSEGEPLNDEICDGNDLSFDSEMDGTAHSEFESDVEEILSGEEEEEEEDEVEMQCANYHRKKHENVTDIECPECKLRTRNVKSFLVHLRKMHSTTPALAGLILLCQCGHESYSERHSEVCEIANITIIRENDGPIRRVTDKKIYTTPQCIMCEEYPKTMRSYATHLHQKHKSNIRKNGVLLLCDCGHTERSMYVNRLHAQRCRRSFAVCKINGKGEKNLTENGAVAETPKIPIATLPSKPRVTIDTFFNRGTIKKDQTVGEGEKELANEDVVEKENDPKETPKSTKSAGRKRRRSIRLLMNSECMDDSDEDIEPPRKKVQ